LRNRSVKLSVIGPILLVNPALHPEPLVTLGISDGDVILALPRDLQAGFLQSQNHAAAISDRLGGYEARQILMDALAALPQPEALLRPLRRSLKL